MENHTVSGSPDGGPVFPGYPQDEEVEGVKADTGSTEATKAALQPDGHIRRPLPPTSSISERFLRGGAQTTQAMAATPEDALRQICKLNRAVYKRLALVEQNIKELGSTVDDSQGVDPTQHAEFRSFIQGQLAYYNMYYVMFGGVPSDATSIDPSLAAETTLGDVPAAPSDAAPIDPALASNPAFQLAVESGFDPYDDSTYTEDLT